MNKAITVANRKTLRAEKLAAISMPTDRQLSSQARRVKKYFHWKFIRKKCLIIFVLKEVLEENFKNVILLLLKFSQNNNIT